MCSLHKLYRHLQKQPIRINHFVPNVGKILENTCKSIKYIWTLQTCNFAKIEILQRYFSRSLIKFVSYLLTIFETPNLLLSRITTRWLLPCRIAFCWRIVLIIFLPGVPITNWDIYIVPMSVAFFTFVKEILGCSSSGPKNVLLQYGNTELVKLSIRIYY